jgi:hypothetical protein
MSISRRDFAKAVGAGLLTLPFLGRRRADAATGPKVRRVFLLCTMGTNPELWKPRSATDIFSVFTDPLQVMKDHIILVDGLMSSDPGENHGSPEALTGKGFGDNNKISVDQYLAQNVTSADPFPALLLGAKTSGGVRMFWDDRKGGSLSVIDSPIDAYATIFASAAAGGNAAAQVARNRSVLDVGLDETAAFTRNLGASDRAKLDLYAQAIRDAESKLVVPPGVVAPPAPTQDGSNLVAADIAHIDLGVAAMAAGLTRVVGLQVGSDQSIQVDTTDINGGRLQGDVHGGFIHGGAGNGYAQLKAWEQKCAKDYFVYICNKLKALPEADGNGTLFDNTLVVWARDMGDSVNHNQSSFPFVLASGSNAYLKLQPGGRYVHYNSSSSADRHERLLLNILNGMGLSSFSGFGKLTGSDQTPLSEIANV